MADFLPLAGRRYEECEMVSSIVKIQRQSQMFIISFYLLIASFVNITTHAFSPRGDALISSPGGTSTGAVVRTHPFFCHNARFKRSNSEVIGLCYSRSYSRSAAFQLRRNGASLDGAPSGCGELDSEDKESTLSAPKHVAFICDGNSRWAERRRLPASAGHTKGADSLIAVLKHLKFRGVRVATFYGFSTENWSRPSNEINHIWSVMEKTADRFYETALREKVAVKILGDINDSRIPLSLQKCLVQLERDTSKFAFDSVDQCMRTSGMDNRTRNDDPTVLIGNGRGNDTLTVCIAINYGGRKDILNAGLRFAKALESGEISSESADESSFGRFLCTSDLPDPDLIVRTGGERRLSNFLLWNLAYSEIYFTDVLWPDFDKNCMDKALDWYRRRCRRYGGRNENEAIEESTINLF